MPAVDRGRLEPGGGRLAADAEARAAASASEARTGNGSAARWSLPLGPAIAWISMVLVTQPARGQGLGTRLLSRCLAEVEASGVAAGLDATELGRPIYLPLGFRDVYPLSRWHARRRQRARRSRRPPACVVRAGDAGRSAADRRLRSAAQRLCARPRSSPICCRARRRWRTSPSGRTAALAGYALGRDGHRAAYRPGRRRGRGDRRWRS